MITILSKRKRSYILLFSIKERGEVEKGLQSLHSLPCWTHYEDSLRNKYEWRLGKKWKIEITRRLWSSTSSSRTAPLYSVPHHVQFTDILDNTDLWVGMCEQWTYADSLLPPSLSLLFSLSYLCSRLLSHNSYFICHVMWLKSVKRCQTSQHDTLYSWNAASLYVRTLQQHCVEHWNWRAWQRMVLV